MTLPKIDTPIYELTLPSTGQTIVVRPFIVKEEKLLLQALASKDDKAIIETTKQIVNNCILTPGIAIDKLPFFDVDYMFIFLRAKSVGESISVNFRCNNVPPEKPKCNFVFPADVNISNVEVANLDTEKTIRLTDKMVVKMKYPSYEVMKRLTDADDDISRKVKVIAACIDRVIDGDNTYTPKDYSKEDFEEFIGGFTEDQFRKVSAFVDAFPHFYIVAEEKCPKCGFHHRIEYTDFTSFFR